MKQYYIGVTVLKRSYEKVVVTCEKEPTKEDILRIMKADEQDDITDEETLDYEKVEEIELLETTDLEDEDDEGGITN